MDFSVVKTLKIYSWQLSNIYRGVTHGRHAVRLSPGLHLSCHWGSLRFDPLHPLQQLFNRC